MQQRHAGKALISRLLREFREQAGCARKNLEIACSPLSHPLIVAPKMSGVPGLTKHPVDERGVGPMKCTLHSQNHPTIDPGNRIGEALPIYLTIFL